MGPLIDFFNNKVSIPFLNKANKGDSKMDFNELNKKRYSCKKFSDKPVEEKKTADNSGSWPSGSNCKKSSGTAYLCC